MKNILFFLFLISSFCYSQNNIELSKKIEKEGWEFYFNNNPDKAKLKFKESLNVNPKNGLAVIGLMVTSEESELDESIDFESFLTNKNSEIDSMQWMTENDIFLALYMDQEVRKSMTKEILNQRELYDTDFIQFKHMLLETPFEIKDEDGVIRQKGQFKNLRPIGKLSNYDADGKLMFEYIYPENGNIVTQNYYTDNDELAKQIITRGDPFHGSSHPIKEIIYWQENTGKEPKFLFVSKEGFTIYDELNPIVLDKNTPDNVIEKVWENNEMKSYIWKNGKREPHLHCEKDGAYRDDLNDGTIIEYHWKDCKKIIDSKFKITD